MTTEERLRRMIGYLGVSVRQFEIQCGLGNGYVNNAPRMLSEKKADQIVSRYPCFDKHWLMEGTGEMLSGNLPVVEEQLFSESSIESENYPAEEKEWKNIIDRLVATNERLVRSNEELVAMNRDLLARLLKCTE